MTTAEMRELIIRSRETVSNRYNRGLYFITMELIEALRVIEIDESKRLKQVDKNSV